MITVGLVQINNQFSGQCYFPYSVGMLQAYAQKQLKRPEQFQFLLPLYTRLPVGQAVAQLQTADIVGFSVYVWNFELSTAIAAELKRQKPETLIVFGGPHLPDSLKQFQRIRKTQPQPADLKRRRIHFTEDFHRAYPCVDIACHGEGEEVFTLILEQFARDRCQDRSSIPSISYRDEQGQLQHHFRIRRLTDLSVLPSPYSSGVFDELMAAYPDQQWIGMWETDRGCPYQCSYCDWGGLVEDRIAKFSLENVFQDIAWFGRRRIPYLFCANANFGILERDVTIAQWLAEAKRQTGFPAGISVQNAKNPKPHTLRALEILEQAGINKATVMSVQSLNPATLKAVRRDNMPLDQYYTIQQRLARQGVYTMSDLILAMPEETYDSFADGIGELIQRGQHNRIQFNNLSILPNAEMGDPEYEERYAMQTVRSRIINIHGQREESTDGVDEWQELVIATSTLTLIDWRQVRVLAWLTGLLYFNKLAQLPLLITHRLTGISYRELFELFSEGRYHGLLPEGKFTVLDELRQSFLDKALAMQNGGEEFSHSAEHLNIWWPPDELVFIQLCQQDKLDDFYLELWLALQTLLDQRGLGWREVIWEAIQLNRLLIKLPSQRADAELTVQHNIWEFYEAARTGQPAQLQSGEHHYHIDRTSEYWSSWSEWCQKVVWWGNRRGAYLYGNRVRHPAVAGHY